MYKLFVSGFPLDISEMELAMLFAPHGNITTIKIVRDRKTRICKGYAFVEMQTEQDAANAAASLDGSPMGDRYLTVNSVPEQPAPSPSLRPGIESRPIKARTTTNAYSPKAADKPKRPRKQF